MFYEIIFFIFSVMLFSGCVGAPVKPVTIQDLQASVKQERDRKNQISNSYLKEGFDHVSKKQLSRAESAFKRSLNFNPDNQAALNALNGLNVKFKPSVELKSVNSFSLNLVDVSIKDLFDLVRDITGLNFVIEASIHNQKTTVNFIDSGIPQLLMILARTNNLEFEVLDSSLVSVTSKKRIVSDGLFLEVFYLTYAKAPDIKKLIETSLSLESVISDETLNALVVKDTKKRLAMVKDFLSAVDIRSSEVMLEIEVLEVSKDSLKNFGLNLSGDSVTGGYFPGQSVTLNQLASSSLGDALTFSALPQVVFNFQKSQAGSTTLANPKLRVLSRQKAMIHMGDRVPSVGSILLSTGTAVSKIDYLDVGVKLSVEPFVHNDGNITVNLGLEVSSIGNPVKDKDGAIITYQVGTRKTETVLLLQDGETQIIGGMIRDEERESKKQIAGLSDIPLIGRLFSSRSSGTVKTEVLLSITPRIINLFPFPESNVFSFVSTSDAPVRSGLSGSARPSGFSPGGPRNREHQGPVINPSISPVVPQVQESPIQPVQ